MHIVHSNTNTEYRVNVARLLIFLAMQSSSVLGGPGCCSGEQWVGQAASQAGLKDSAWVALAGRPGGGWLDTRDTPNSIHCAATATALTARKKNLTW